MKEHTMELYMLPISTGYRSILWKEFEDVGEELLLRPGSPDGRRFGAYPYLLKALNEGQGLLDWRLLGPYRFDDCMRMTQTLSC